MSKLPAPAHDHQGAVEILAEALAALKTRDGLLAQLETRARDALLALGYSYELAPLPPMTPEPIESPDAGTRRLRNAVVSLEEIIAARAATNPAAMKGAA